MLKSTLLKIESICANGDLIIPKRQSGSPENSRLVADFGYDRLHLMPMDECAPVAGSRKFDFSASITLAVVVLNTGRRSEAVLA